MEIYDFPSELQEKIFLRVYERQCFDIIIATENPSTKLVELLWSYKNNLARSIIWKWIVWWFQRSLLPPSLEIVQDHIYNRFRKMIHCSYINLYGIADGDIFNNPLTLTDRKSEDKTQSPLPLRWYHIEPEIYTFLKTFMNIKNKEQIEKHILRVHKGMGGLNREEKILLITCFCDRFPSRFLPELCSCCGKQPNSFDHIITYPCKHKVCRTCFFSRVSENDTRCYSYDIETSRLCEGKIKQKGWNYYLLNRCANKNDYQKCKSCGYYRHLTCFSGSVCAYCLLISM